MRALAPGELERMMLCPAPVHNRARSCCLKHAQHFSLVEDYVFIGGDAISSALVAERLGVTRRTVERIRAELRRLTNGRLGAYTGPRHTRYARQ